ncbi:MAG: hypothetical protein AVDCRST_MAG52-2837, partial [uncultured Blastococcus sp.]
DNRPRPGAAAERAAHLPAQARPRRPRGPARRAPGSGRDQRTRAGRPAPPGRQRPPVAAGGRRTPRGGSDHHGRVARRAGDQRARGAPCGCRRPAPERSRADRGRAHSARPSPPRQRRGRTAAPRRARRRRVRTAARAADAPGRGSLGAL